MNESPDRRLRKFNPGMLQSDEEVTRQFVVRQRELDIVLEVIHGNIDSSSCQHVLVVAPRGQGKSMLLARIAAELRTDAELSNRLFPVRFMEESQEILSLADFWLEALFHLARESKTHHSDLSRELHETHAGLTARWREDELAEHARAAVLEAADRLGKKLVLMVENMQTLCSDVDDDFGWKLRQALQSEPQIMLLATATSRFKGLDNARQPFFELFRIVDLEPLATEDCRRLWQMISGEEVNRYAIRPLQILTGGNPRLLVIVAQFAHHRSLHQLMEELAQLIDIHTEYFRSHLEVFAKTERRVYLAAIDLWRPSSAREIASRARMDIRTVSALLGRLVDRGAIVVEGTGQRRRYVIAERLYSIYYKLRRQRGEASVVQLLIHFMVAFYGAEELAEERHSPLIRDELKQAKIEIPQLGNVFAPIAQPDAETARLFEEVHTALNQQEWKKIIEIADQFFASQRAGWPPVPKPSVALIFMAQAAAQQGQGKSEAAIASFDEVVERFGASDVPELKVHVATALVQKGVTEEHLGESEAAIVSFDEVVERFGASDTPQIQRQVASALDYRGYTLNRLGWPEAAFASFDKVVERFGAGGAPEIDAHVARSLVHKGVVLSESEAAVAIYDDVVYRFGASDAPEVQAQVARALGYRGHRQLKLGQSEEAIASFEEVVERFGESDAPDLKMHAATALFNKGVMLGETAAAIAIYDEVVQRFGASHLTGVQMEVASALFVKGFTQMSIEHSEPAITTFAAVVERFGASYAPRFELEVVTALSNERASHGQGSAAAIAAYDAVVGHFNDSNIRELQMTVARWLAKTGIALGQTGELKAAIATFAAMVERFGASDAPELQVDVATALLNKGVAQRQRGENAAALAAYDELIERFGESAIPELQKAVASALINRGDIQVEIGWAEEALRTCDELDRGFAASTDNAQVDFEWRTMWLKTHALLLHGKRLAAMDAFRLVCGAFIPGNESMLHEMLRRVPDLIVAGASERGLVEILSTDSKNADALAPLVVALRQLAGESVRAPAEVLEVAADIRECIEAKRKA